MLVCLNRNQPVGAHPLRTGSMFPALAETPLLGSGQVGFWLYLDPAIVWGHSSHPIVCAHRRFFFFVFEWGQKTAKNRDRRKTMPLKKMPAELKIAGKSKLRGKIAPIPPANQPAKEPSSRFLQHPTPRVPQQPGVHQAPKATAVSLLDGPRSSPEHRLVEHEPAPAAHRSSAEVSPHQRLDRRRSGNLRSRAKGVGSTVGWLTGLQKVAVLCFLSVTGQNGLCRPPVF